MPSTGSDINLRRLGRARAPGIEINKGGGRSCPKPRNKKKLKTMKGYMYILECADGSYYTGSTTNLELRLQQHQSGEGANHTRKRLPVQLVYYEEFDRIDEAFYREKQVQGWSRRKKEALMENRANDLPLLSKNYTDKD